MTRIRVCRSQLQDNPGPWAILPEMLLCVEEDGEIKAADAAAPEASAQARDTGKGSVAVVPVRGVITARGDRYRDSVSAGGIRDQIMAAAANPNVSATVLDIDSPGGSVYGIEEVADAIHASRKASGGKPIVSMVSGLAASAAYWIAAAADTIVASPSSSLGSIGVYAVHMNMQKMAEQMGVVPTIIAAGKYKTEGHPLVELTEDAVAWMQSQVDSYYDAFVGDVARGRRITASTVRSDFGEGRMMTARAALAQGMVDRIGGADQVVSAIRSTSRQVRALAIRRLHLLALGARA